MGRARICLITTGGTIGMVRVDGVLRPPDDPVALLEIAPEIHQIAEVTVVPLCNKDSVNMTPADWSALASTIHARLGPEHGYDGFVITHGTDTMQFTAAALAFALGPELAVPVVLTGSQTDAGSLHGDARTNLVRAVLVATGVIAEVMICFGDLVFRGVRAQKRDRRRFAAFESPASSPLAEIATEVIVHPRARRRPSVRPSQIPPLQADFSPQVVQLPLLPGLRPDSVQGLLDPEHVSGVILQTFGAGNVPDEGELSFIPFIRTAVATGLPVILTSQFPASSTVASPYATGAGAVRAGAIATHNMTNSAAYVKLRWTVAQVSAAIAGSEIGVGERLAEISRRMGHCYVGELDPDPDDA
ncbi:MAG TPA: asparaginase [Pseudonocardiaceae bacterium]|nr:asparaginase [Pseudonocardiaceae bacterium]